MYIYPCIGKLHVVISRLSPNNLYFKKIHLYMNFWQLHFSLPNLLSIEIYFLIGLPIVNIQKRFLPSLGLLFGIW